MTIHEKLKIDLKCAIGQKTFQDSKKKNTLHVLTR